MRSAQTLAVSLPIDGLQGACAKYAGGSCCSEDTSLAIAENTFFSAEADYRWDRCYVAVESFAQELLEDPTLKAEFDLCQAWFHQEQCFFECDVNIGTTHSPDQLTFCFVIL